MPNYALNIRKKIKNWRNNCKKRKN